MKNNYWKERAEKFNKTNWVKNLKKTKKRLMK